MVDLAAERGTSLIDAAEALRRQQFAHHVTNELNTLRTDASAWADYLAEPDSSHVGDGLA